LTNNLNLFKLQENKITAEHCSQARDYCHYPNKGIFQNGDPNILPAKFYSRIWNKATNLSIKHNIELLKNISKSII